MKFYVYVLLSIEDNSVYIGQTDNLEARLKRHNAGEVRSTKSHIPWRLILSEAFCTRSAAMRRERELKSHKGRDFIRGLIELE